MARLLRIASLACLLSSGCEGIPVVAPGNVGGTAQEEGLAKPDYVAEVRAVLWVDAQQLVVRAEGDILLRPSTTPGDAYALHRGSLEQSNAIDLHRRFNAAADPVPISDPRLDVSIPIGAFALTDLSGAPRHTILIRNQDAASGVASYQRIAIDFLRATTLR